MAVVIAAALAALGSYIAASRRLSGKIATSEADSLWKESASIREDYRSRIAEAERRQAHLEERLAKVEERNIELGQENVELRASNAEKSLVIERCQSRLAQLERENQTLKVTIRRIAASDD